MELADYSRFFFAFLFVVGLMWAISAAVKRFGLDQKLRGVTAGAGRLSVSEVLYLDPRRKLTLVRADGREYLLLLTADQVQVVDKFEVKA